MYKLRVYSINSLLDSLKAEWQAESASVSTRNLDTEIPEYRPTDVYTKSRYNITEEE
jgi:hypothetical protein